MQYQNIENDIAGIPLNENGMPEIRYKIAIE